MDCRLWVHRGTALDQTELKPTEARYFGRTGDSSNDGSGAQVPVDYLCVNLDRELATLCAQELYAMFLFKVVGGVKEVCGTTARHTNDSSPELPAAPGRKHGVWAQFRLNNTNLAPLKNLRRLWPWNDRGGLFLHHSSI